VGDHPLGQITQRYVASIHGYTVLSLSSDAFVVVGLSTIERVDSHAHALAGAETAAFDS
jgi:hypothetical protein